MNVNQKLRQDLCYRKNQTVCVVKKRFRDLPTLYTVLNRVMAILSAIQGVHMLEKYLNLEGFLKKSLKIQSALKSTEKSLKMP